MASKRKSKQGPCGERATKQSKLDDSTEDAITLQSYEENESAPRETNEPSHHKQITRAEKSKATRAKKASIQAALPKTELKSLVSPGSGFPKLKDGDVHIIIHPTNTRYQYLLRSADLKPYSERFRHMLDEPVDEVDPKLLTKKSNAKYNKQFRFELQSVSLARNRWKLVRAPFTQIVPDPQPKHHEVTTIEDDDDVVPSSVPPSKHQTTEQSSPQTQLWPLKTKGDTAEVTGCLKNDSGAKLELPSEIRKLPLINLEETDTTDGFDPSELIASDRVKTPRSSSPCQHTTTGENNQLRSDIELEMSLEYNIGTTKIPKSPLHSVLGPVTQSIALDGLQAIAGQTSELGSFTDFPKQMALNSKSAMLSQLMSPRCAFKADVEELQLQQSPTSPVARPAEGESSMDLLEEVFLVNTNSETLIDTEQSQVLCGLPSASYSPQPTTPNTLSSSCRSSHIPPAALNFESAHMHTNGEIKPVSTFGMDGTIDEGYTSGQEAKDQGLTGRSLRSTSSSHFGTNYGNRVSPSVTSIGPPMAYCEAYDNLLAVFYRRPICMSTQNIREARLKCCQLLGIASDNECKLLRPELHLVLTRFKSELWDDIRRSPFEWLELSTKLQHRAIFEEAIVHIVGGFYDVSLKFEISQRQLALPVIKLIKKKWDELFLNIKICHERLFFITIYFGEKPVQLAGLDDDTYGSWLVVQHWRQWLVQAFQGPDHEKGSLYRTIFEGGDAYLPAHEVTKTLKDHIGNDATKLQQVLEDLNDLKQKAKEFVEELCINNTHLSPESCDMKHVCCTQVQYAELPWVASK